MIAKLDPAGIEQFCRLLEAHSGLCYSPEKAYLFESRLRELLLSEAIADYNGLNALWQRQPALRQRIVEALVTGETYFFRDTSTFEALPALLPPGPYSAESPLVIWSIGCSSGQEACSILIRLQEAGWGPERVRVVGLDISEAVLARAREGRYDAGEIRRGLSEERRAYFFEPDGSTWRLRAPWRRALSFVQANVAEHLPLLERPHLVFCRNILIYFSDATKAQVLRRVAERLRDTGLLLLGNTENALAHPRLFEPLPDRTISAYRKPLGGQAHRA